MDLKTAQDEAKIIGDQCPWLSDDQLKAIEKALCTEPSPEKKGDTMIIFDAINGWVNDNNRETIPRKAFLEIAKAAADDLEDYHSTLPTKGAEIYAVKQQMDLVQRLYDGGIRGAGDLKLTDIAKELHKQLDELEGDD